MEEGLVYQERITSNWTEALFLLLAALFFVLLVIRWAAGNTDALAAVFFSLFLVFLVYSLNYRTLVVRVTDHALILQFGIFKWRVPLENINGCRLDDNLPAIKKYGGAGIHFFFADRRYRASFNFLEHPRVVVQLKQKAGLVEEVSFTTRLPEEVLRLLRERAAVPSAADTENGPGAA